ncbi:cationic amino acid transporter 2-like [Schistocerca americana]|uniref:cationic amino acid transporter 2-like n=1 Tax=Schistocerca americana TaxID=7009 RepID=UPI001F4FC6FF|nr:cationic amino acid transporter 2-like [Schistocerca americana]XP_049957586.1 cationic amino acid transporter 2-like [Schistocerca serialis cubense]
MWTALRALSRQKTLSAEAVSSSQLSRCLSVLDLTLLGVGSTLGLGVYVLAGAVARDEAGPAVTISFLVAAIASAFAGICYAEFAARVPRAGSAYVYSYVCVGEFVAFVIGWNLILEYVIGTASVARGLSSYVDTLVNGTMERTMKEVMPMKINFLSSYPDFLSLGMILVLTGILSTGVKESTLLNNVFTGINIIVILIVIISGAIKADPNNWKILKEDIPSTVTNPGEGGFLPFGVAGVMAGAAKCFYGFVGFDCVATTGEEAKNPQRSIPISIVISLVIIFLSYFGISTVLTMMWPYYDQDPHAPLPYVFSQVGWPAIMWIVTTGAVFALCTSLLGAMFPLPRILYAMASDGLLFQFLAKVHPRSQTPVLATVVSGIFAGIMAAIFDLQHLIDMMSIGTLLAYTIVAICVLILRYEDPSPASFEHDLPKKEINVFNAVLLSLKHLFNFSLLKYPTELTSTITKWAVVIFSLIALMFCATLIHAGDFVQQGEMWAVILLAVLAFLMMLTLAVIARQPVSTKDLSFKVPLVPMIPALSVLINLYLMLMLDRNTWIRFSVWLVIGFIIYFGYGIRKSEEAKYRKSKELENVQYHESKYQVNQKQAPLASQPPTFSTIFKNRASYDVKL